MRSLFAVLLLASAARAEVVPGEWTTNFHDGMDFAERTCTPILVFYGNTGCGHCNNTGKLFKSDTFKEWSEEKPIVLVNKHLSTTEYIRVEKGDVRYQDSIDASKWCDEKTTSSCSSYPLVRVYWKKPGGGEVAPETHCGEFGSAAKLVAWLDGILKDYTVYSGPTFGFSGTDGDRLEAETNRTEYVDIPLFRRNVKETTTSTITVTWPAVSGVGKTTTNVTWEASSETRCLVRVEIPSPARLVEPDSEAKLTLADENGKTQGEGAIHFVAPENSAANPKWIGENFGWGEWTMDLAAATDKVARADGEAYVVVSMQGSMWCPDCANVDRNFLDLEEDGVNRFRAWAETKQIALVTVDIPNFKGKAVTDFASPTLLSRTAYASTLARAKEWPASGADASLTNAMLRSGLGYLTRNMVSDEKALEVLTRNHDLATLNTSEGGFHRPEDSNAYRTGVPIFVVLRKDGTVAARLTRMASVSPMESDREYFDDYIRRFDEMLAIAAETGAHVDRTEIDNNHPSTTPVELAANSGEAPGEICNADFMDVFALRGIGGNALETVRIVGKTDARVKVTLLKWNVKPGKYVEVESTNGVLSEVGVKMEFEPVVGNEYFIKVEGANITNAEFALESSVSTNFHPFTVTATEILLPLVAKRTSPAGAESSVVRLVAGSRYRLTGLAAVGNEEVLEKDGDFWIAKKGGDQTIKRNAVQAFEYQLWQPGEISFVPPARASVKEDCGTYEIRVRRTGGSGAASVGFKCLGGAEESRYAWDPDTVLTWPDGGTDEQTLVVRIIDDFIRDGEQTVTFALTGCVASVAQPADPKEFALTILEDDKDKTGRLAISSVGEPYYFAKAMTVYAPAGAELPFTVVRELGALGETRATLKTSAGTLDSSELTWISNDRQASRSVNLQLPEKGDCPSGKVTVTLKSESGAPVYSKARVMTIILTDTDQPSFATAALSEVLVKGVKFNWECGITLPGGGVPSLTKVSGTLAAGLKASILGGNTFTLSGVPTKAGSFTAVYRVNAKIGGKTVTGGTIQLAFTVRDLAKVPVEEGGNPYLAKARTFTGLMAFDNVSGAFVGLLNLTIQPSGKASAKLTTESGVTSFSATSWERSEAGVMWTTLYSKWMLDETQQQRDRFALTIAVRPDGSVDGLVVTAFDAGKYRVETDGRTWSKADPATVWKGRYTVAYAFPEAGAQPDLPDPEPELVPLGEAWMSVQMTAKAACQSGKMTYAGMLANGKTFSGSAVLVRAGANARLPVFVRKTGECFAAVLEIAADAAASYAQHEHRTLAGADGVPARWSHRDSKATEAASYVVTYDAFGAYYDPDEDFSACLEKGEVSNVLTFFADEEQITRVVVGSGKSGKFKPDSTTTSITLNRATGVVKGTFFLSDGVKYSYQGIVLPGWQGCNCGDFDLPAFVFGSYWFKDKVEYLDAKERIRTTSVIRGGSVQMQTQNR